MWVSERRFQHRPPRLSHAVFRPQRPVSHSVRINALPSLSRGIPLWQSASNPSASLRDMKAADFDPLFTNPHPARYILSPTSLFAALKKSDREASQLAPSVPLLSYRGAAGCAGLRGSHWWAVLCRTEALLSGWKGLLQDDFRWITAVIVLFASSFPLPEPLHPPFFHFVMSHHFIPGDMDCTSFLLLKFCCCVILPPASFHLKSSFVAQPDNLRQKELPQTHSCAPDCQWLWHIDINDNAKGIKMNQGGLGGDNYLSVPQLSQLLAAVPKPPWRVCGCLSRDFKLGW